MTKAEFQEWTRENIIYLDGATGTSLLKRGMPGGVCPEGWILEHRQTALRLQQEYVEAGSNILYAPTFSANRIKLAEYGLKDELQKVNKELVGLSKEAAAGRALVAGDVTMTGEQLFPIGRMDFEHLIEIYKEQIRCLDEGGADLLVVETMMSLQEARAALIAAKECSGLPVMVTMTFEADGRTLYGTDAVTAAVTLESLGAAAVGANCSAGPDRMAPLIEAMAAHVGIPVIAKPNAGMPRLSENGMTEYDMGPEAFAQEMEQLVRMGASVLGGCCGTTPEHIRRLIERTRGLKRNRRTRSGLRYLTSERKTLAFGLCDPFMIVGERINPTGKKKLQEQLRNGSFELVRQFARQQEEKGASVLDVNMGMGGIDEKSAMLTALTEVTQASSLPLSLDTSHVGVMEAALRHYPGRALINSISMESAKMEPLLKLAAEYGAMFILLPLSDAGLPADSREKIKIIDQVVNAALKHGLKKEDIVVDGLVATVGAQPEAALDTLDTIRYCRRQGLATVCGLSNISFGLPERSYLNAAFLTMAVKEGLTMAIANPGQELLGSAAFAADLLLNKKGSDVRYIERMNSLKAPEGKPSPESAQQAFGAQEQLYDAVLKGTREGVIELTKRALDEGASARELLDGLLIPAINEVGELFDKGRYFLPQLIASAETMKRAIEYLEPLLMTGGRQKEMPVVIIATVKGDIHDIGKNLVALMFKNYGFEVVDLGKDVSKEDIIGAARSKGAAVIALSALMTTTMQEMKRVIDYRNEQKLTVPVMVGGAVVTQEYADEIGADGYSKDAADAVRVAKRILGLSE